MIYIVHIYAQYILIWAFLVSLHIGENMKTTKQITCEVIDNYIIDNFSISLVGNDTKFAEQQFPHTPMHGLVFILILSGTAIIHTNGKNYSAHQKMFISIAPFQSYTFSEQSDEFQFERITFKLDFMADFPLMLQPNVAEKMERLPCIFLNKNNFTLFKKYYGNIQDQYKRDKHPSRINIIKASLYILVAEASYIYSLETVNVKSTHQEQVTDDFFRLLHTFYRKERKPDFYADKLYLSTKYLTKILKKVTGLTLYAWICEFIIKEAKIMLNSTNASILQISDELNFPNSSYFTRYFKKYTGMTPLEFRKHKV